MDLLRQIHRTEKGTVRNRAVVALVAVSLVVAVGLAQGSAKKLIIISWDGNAAWVVDQLLVEKKLPNVSRLAHNGVRAEYVIPPFPSKTAPGHAAIWTGAYSDINGVTGNTVPLLPRREHTILEQQDGFDSSALRAEPIWLTALLAGKRVATLSATHSAPATPYVKAMQAAGIPVDRLTAFDGFQTEIASANVLAADTFGPAVNWPGLRAEKGRAKEAEVRIGEALFNILIFDAPDDPVDGFDTAVVCPGQKVWNHPDCATLKPFDAAVSTSHWSKAFSVQKGDLFGLTYFRLFALAPDGSRITLYQRASHGFQSTTSREMTESYLRAAGGFTDEGFAPYRDGRLGPQLWESGDGTAERRLLEIIRLNLQFQERGTRYALERLNADVIFHYSSATDDAGHTWMGVLDPDSPAYDPRLAAKIWPFYAEVFQLQDAWLGQILDSAGPDTIVSLVGDHGMSGVAKTFYPNAVLERAGLLVRTPDGKIDLTKTQICAPPWGDYFLALNSTDWKDGIVEPAERQLVLQRATEALLSAVDPENGKHIVTRVFRPSEVVGLGIGGPTGGDLYLDFADGYAPSAAAVTDVMRKAPLQIGVGQHGFYPQRAKMQTVWFVSGPGVAAGRRIGGIRQIDIAPTLSRLMGIPAPKNAQGHVIGEVLAAGPGESRRP